MRFVVGPASQIPPGSVAVVYPEKIKSGIGIFNVDGEFYALKNTCPHQGGPLCNGRVRGTSASHIADGKQPEIEWSRDGEIISCPWHHWEFDIRTGRTIFPSNGRVRSYPVQVATPDELERLHDGVETYDVTIEDATVVVEI